MSLYDDCHTLRVSVFGRVQGVGFRAYVHREAIRRGIRGEVWNSLNGSVEMIVQHEDADKLSAFVAALSSGPGVVTSVESEPLSAVFLEGFRISPTR